MRKHTSRKQKKKKKSEAAEEVRPPEFTGNDVITFRGVSFTYDDPEEAEEAGESVHLALDNLNVTIHRGDCLAVLGHNGSGKSTFGKLCNGILAPDEGDVVCYGINTKDEDRLLDIRCQVGMVFQNPDNQIIASVVEEDVAFGPENLGVPPEEIRTRVDRSLKAVGMYEYRNHAPNKLSGGQKQRVAIAGILAMDPACIIFDESTAMLDPSGRREVMDTIHRLHDEYGKTVVFITHYMEEAATADRIIVIDGGTIYRDGDPYEVFADREGLRKIGLDVPQAAEFSAELREAGWNLPERILSTQKCVDAIASSMGV